MKKIKIALLTVAALAASVGLSWAQPLVPNATTSIRYPFTDPPTGTANDFSFASDPSFGVNLSITNYTRTHGFTNFHGIYGSGTSGLHVACDLSSNSFFATPGGEGSSLGTGGVLVVTNAALQFGSVKSFTATVWCNPKNAANSGTTEIRLFILGATGDKNNANNSSLFWNTANQLDGNVGATAVPGAIPTWPTTDSPGTFPTNQWLFQALVWDGATATLYTGTDGGGTLTVSGTASPVTPINMTGANDELQIGNRQDTLARPFCGWLDDFRFYGSTSTGTAAATANQVEDIFWAGQAPTNLSAIAANNQANLTWSPLANAATYIISRSGTSGGPYTQLASGLTSPNYPDNTAVNGNTYYYVVSAVDGTGDLTTGPYSYEYGFTVIAAPTQPVVTPTAGSDQVVLNWTASTGVPGPITYKVSRSTTPGGEVTIASGLTTTTYTDTTAVSQIAYYYIVTAVNAGLATASTASAEVTATPSGPPPAPTGVAAAADGPGQALVTWTSIGATSYNVYRSTNGAGPFTLLASGVTTTNYLDTTVLLGVPFYYYEVVAVNALSLSSPSSAASGALASGQGNQLANADFELVPLATNWTRTYGAGATGGALNVVTIGGTYYNAGMCAPDAPAQAIVSHNGTEVANSYNYSAAGSVSTWNQLVGATPGSTWASSAWTLASHEDLPGPCIFYYQVDFLDIGGTLLSSYRSYTIQNLVCGGPNQFPLDTWVSLAVTNQMQVTAGTNTGVVLGNTGSSGVMTAPAGTSSVNFQAKFVDVAGHGGSIWFDDCNLDLIAGPVPPTITPIDGTVAGHILCTNTYVTVTAVSSAGTITNAQAIITSHGLTGTTNTVTNNLNATTQGLGSGSAVITNMLTTNLFYNLKIIATDNNGNSISTSATFDTVSPLLVIEAEDFNFNSGQFIDTLSTGGVDTYSNAPLSSVDVDYQKTLPSGNQAANGSYYRVNDVIINGYANPDNGLEQKFAGTTNRPLEVGYNSKNDWLNYTRTFGPGTPGSGVSAPSGTYTVWARLATVGGGPALDFAQITSDPTQPSQTSNMLGSFSFTGNDWAGYQYVPLLDTYGNLVSVSLAGAQTLRATIHVGGNPNIDFYMLMPSTPVLTPALQYAYPDGLHPFEPTNLLTFTIGPANGAAVASSGIHLVLNGADVSAGLSFTPSGNSWIASYAIKSNVVYSGVINVTNTAALSSSFTLNFDTFSANNFQVEAVDYDFSTNNGAAWIGGLYIDNPAPSCDLSAVQTGTFATNSYFGYPTGFTPGNDPAGLGAVAQQGIDINFPNDGQSATSEYYRADGVGSQPASDYVRAQFLAARTTFGNSNIGPLNIGYYGNGYWMNYTRHYPTNTFNVWARLAGGNGAFSGTTLSQVTSGVGTSGQSTVDLGTFADPNAVGWQAWHWIPMLDGSGNKAVVSLGGLETLRLTSGNNVNAEFFMLVPAPLPVQLNAALQGNQVQVAIPTQLGYTYTLMHTISLTNPSWGQIGSVIPGDGTVHNILQSLAGTQGYYQVVVQ